MSNQIDEGVMREPRPIRREQLRVQLPTGDMEPA